MNLVGFLVEHQLSDHILETTFLMRFGTIPTTVGQMFQRVISPEKLNKNEGEGRKEIDKN